MNTVWLKFKTTWKGVEPIISLKNLYINDFVIVIEKSTYTRVYSFFSISTFGKQFTVVKHFYFCFCL